MTTMFDERPYQLESGLVQTCPPQNICNVNPYVCRVMPNKPRMDKPYEAKLMFETAKGGCCRCSPECNADDKQPPPDKKKNTKKTKESEYSKRKEKYLSRKHKKNMERLEKKRRDDFVTACCNCLLKTPCGSAGSYSETCDEKDPANFYIQCKCERKNEPTKLKKNKLKTTAGEFPCQCRHYTPHATGSCERPVCYCEKQENFVDGTGCEVPVKGRKSIHFSTAPFIQQNAPPTSCRNSEPINQTGQTIWNSENQTNCDTTVIVRQVLLQQAKAGRKLANKLNQANKTIPLEHNTTQFSDQAWEFLMRQAQYSMNLASGLPLLISSDHNVGVSNHARELLICMAQSGISLANEITANSQPPNCNESATTARRINKLAQNCLFQHANCGVELANRLSKYDQPEKMYQDSDYLSNSPSISNGIYNNGITTEKGYKQYPLPVCNDRTRTNQNRYLPEQQCHENPKILNEIESKQERSNNLETYNNNSLRSNNQLGHICIPTEAIMGSMKAPNLFIPLSFHRIDPNQSATVCNVVDQRLLANDDPIISANVNNDSQPTIKRMQLNSSNTEPNRLTEQDKRQLLENPNDSKIGTPKKHRSRKPKADKINNGTVKKNDSSLSDKMTHSATSKKAETIKNLANLLSISSEIQSRDLQKSVGPLPPNQDTPTSEEFQKLLKQIKCLRLDLKKYTKDDC